MGKQHIVWIVLLIVVIGVAVGGLWHLDQQAAPKRGAYAALTRCLSERGVKFYGAFWCPNCAAQKALFEGSEKKLPHIECSLPDRSRNELCAEADIKDYPTWEFNGNKRCTGVLKPEVLAHLSGCPLPVYDGIVYTVAYLREQLVTKGITENLRKRGYPESDIQESVTEMTDAIDAYLTEYHQTTAEETEDVAHLLAAVAKVVNKCEPYAREEEIVEEEGEITAEDG